jgi:hypothetical protein
MDTETKPVLTRSTPVRRAWTGWALTAAPLRSAATAILVMAAALLVVSALIHLHLWSTGYRGIPTIGPLFLVQGLVTPLIALALVLTRRLVVVAVAIAGMVGTVGGFVLSDTVGLFGFHDGFAAPFAALSFVIELTAVALLLAGGTLVVRSSRTGTQYASQSHRDPEPVDEVSTLRTGGDERVTVAFAPSSLWPPRR